jgi:hypothetical protein
VPSTLNCTTVTPTLSEALALTVTVVPDTVAPAAGAVRVTVGALVSPTRPDCWVCGVAAFTCAKVVVDVVVAAVVIGVAANVCPVAVVSTLWLVNVGLEGGFDASSVTSCPNRRLRTNATTAHPTGESTGVGLSGATGPKPANPSTPETTPLTTPPGGSVGAADKAWVATRLVCGTE